MDEIIRLKKQMKLLAIATITLGVFTLGLLISTLAGLKSNEAWPDMALGKLTVREIRIVSQDGHTRILLHSDNDPNLAFFDDTGEVRLLLSSSTQGGYLSLIGSDKANRMLLTSGNLLMGEENQANVRLVAPSAGGPRLLLKDENDYAITLGRTSLLNQPDGNQIFTSAASIVASSKNSTTHWPLLTPSMKPDVKAAKRRSP
jgi:hypothetical protein